jgi:hypothetical protein
MLLIPDAPFGPTLTRRRWLRLGGLGLSARGALLHLAFHPQAAAAAAAPAAVATMGEGGGQGAAATWAANRPRPSAPPLWRPMDPIYLDTNATTPLLPAVWGAMRPTC